MVKFSVFRLQICLMTLFLVTGCSASHFHQQIDERVADIIADKQRALMGYEEPFNIVVPADILRHRLLRAQQLPIAGPASLGSQNLPAVPDWPEAQPSSGKTNSKVDNVKVDAVISLSLLEALQVAAQNSREYQSRKEDLYRSALALDFERNAFRSTFSGTIEGDYGQDRSNTESTGGIIEGGAASVVGGAAKLFTSGISLTTQIGWDLVRMLQPGHSSSSGLFGDASITIPLLRGSGRQIAAEPLTQAERDTLYAIWDFERYKKEFAVNLVDHYLAALQADDLLRNQEENYRGLIASSRRASRLAEAGKLPQIQVDQSIQNELSARDRWVAARQTRARVLDSFKNLLGLPTDAAVVLDRKEFSRLGKDVEQRLAILFVAEPPPPTPAADAPILLEPPDPRQAGPFEIAYPEAIGIALKNRLDLRVEEERVSDAQRKVVVAADALRAELTLFGSVATGTRRSIASLQPENSNRIDLNEGRYQGLLTLDLPWERTAEAIAYRDSYISLEQAVRSVQELEDQIKLQVRNDLRDLEQARASLKIQDQAVKLAERRVRGAELQLQAGRAQMRDLLEAREALLGAQNALTAAMVDYRVAELSMQRDLGVLQVDANGIWHEYSFGETKP